MSYCLFGMSNLVPGLFASVLGAETGKNPTDRKVKKWLETRSNSLFSFQKYNRDLLDGLIDREVMSLQTSYFKISTIFFNKLEVAIDSISEEFRASLRKGLMDIKIKYSTNGGRFKLPEKSKREHSLIENINKLIKEIQSKGVSINDIKELLSFVRLGSISEIELIRFHVPTGSVRTFSQEQNTSLKEYALILKDYQTTRLAAYIKLRETFKIFKASPKDFKKQENAIKLLEDKVAEGGGSEEVGIILEQKKAVLESLKSKKNEARRVYEEAKDEFKRSFVMKYSQDKDVFSSGCDMAFKEEEVIELINQQSTQYLRELNSIISNYVAQDIVGKNEELNSILKDIKKSLKNGDHVDITEKYIKKLETVFYRIKALLKEQENPENKSQIDGYSRALDFYMSPIIFNIKNLFTALNERTITESEHVNAFSFRSVNEAEAVRKTEARESAEGIIAEEAVRKTEARESAEGRIAAEAIRDAAASRMYEENRMKKFNKRIYNRMIQAGIPESAVIQFRLLSIANEIIKTLPFSSVAERVNLLNGSMWSGSLVLEIFGKRVYSKDERPSGHEVTHLFSETVLLKHPIIKVLRYGILNARFFAKHAGFVNNLFSSLANEGVMEKPFKTDTPYQIHERVGQVLIEASSLAQAKGIYFGVNFDSKNESIVLSRDISKCRNSLETLRSYLNDGIRGRQIPVRSESGFALKQGAAMLNMFILNFERFEAGLTDEGGNILQYCYFSYRSVFLVQNILENLLRFIVYEKGPIGEYNDRNHDIGYGCLNAGVQSVNFINYISLTNKISYILENYDATHLGVEIIQTLGSLLKKELSGTGNITDEVDRLVPLLKRFLKEFQDDLKVIMAEISQIQ